jgi:replicative DNA helicase
VSGYKKEEVELRDYSEDTQKLLIQFMLSDNAAFVRCQNIVRAEYWNDRLKPAVRYILKFANEFRALPTPEQVEAETGVATPKIEGIGEQHSAWFLKTVEDFCKNKAMEALVHDGPMLIAKGDYAELERRSKENMLISLQTELGTDYFENPKERLERMRDRTDTTPTGWKDIDSKLYGGFNRGEISFFCGGPGTGKSLFLQNLALNWVQMGLNVIYITMELSEELVGLRFDAMVTSTPTKQIFKNLDEVAMRLGMMRKTTASKWGKLQIKKLPMAGTKANDIRAYLQEYEIQTGSKPDAIVVDYLDLMHPNSGKINVSDQFIKDKFTSEELRAVAVEWNILAATASQLNRASIQEQDFDASHIAGGISKINTADNVMAILTTASMKERGEYQIQFLKTRSSSGVGQKIFLQIDSASLRITDMPEDMADGRSSNNVTDMMRGLQNKVSSNIATTKEPASIGTSYQPSPATVPASPSANSSTSESLSSATALRGLINRSRK